MIDFAHRLKLLRVQNNLTQDQFATRIGLEKDAVSAYEHELRLPSYLELIQIAQFFQVSTDYLLGCDHDYDTVLNLNGLTEEEKLALKQLLDALKSRSQL